MIMLYSGSGSQEVQVLENVLPDQAWTIEKRSIVRLLKAKNNRQAAAILESTPFELCKGTNGFNDEFCILYYHAQLEQYVTIAEEYEKREVKLAYQDIAEAVTEVNHYIRFIVVDLDTDSNVEVVPVVSPSLEISSDSVKRALADAEHLIHARGAASGVDRVHTAFHGYLKAVAKKASITFPEDSSVTSLFKLLRAKHPALVFREPRATDIDRVLQSMASIIDSLNPVRNRASGAHPNKLVLREPEAMLIINSVNTLLHYLDTRFREVA
ncbi:MAG: abortive infection family protein [Candidatus Brocadiales bacterium]|nr:abortive infection family protein [Candidatus Brocadiales bacterium]